jgi:hypothetical protein
MRDLSGSQAGPALSAHVVRVLMRMESLQMASG